MHEAQGTWETERKQLIDERTSLIQARTRLTEELTARLEQAERRQLSLEPDRRHVATQSQEDRQDVASTSQAGDAEHTTDVTDEPAPPEESRPAA